MSKFNKLLSIMSLVLLTSFLAKAEPATLGPAGSNAPETRNSSVACLNCSSEKASLPGGNASLGENSPTAAAPGIEPFGDNPHAGRAVLNGGDMDGGGQPGTKDPVPEPATVALLGAGLTALIIGLKRRG